MSIDNSIKPIFINRAVIIHHIVCFSVVMITLFADRLTGIPVIDYFILYCYIVSFSVIVVFFFVVLVTILRLYPY